MTVLESFSWRQGGGRAIYPWDLLLDGRIHRVSGEDFPDFDAKGCGAQARNAAKRRGLKIRVSVSEKENTLVLQAFKPEAETNGHVESNGVAEQAPAKKSRKSRKVS